MIWKTLLIVLISLSFGGLAYAAANSPIMQQRDSVNSSTINRVVGLVGEDAIFYFDHTTKLPKLVPVTTLLVPGPTGLTGATGAAGTNATTTANATQSVSGLMSAGDKVIVDSLGTASILNAPASGNATSVQAVKGSDTRLTDARTPTAHTQSIGTITGNAVVGTTPKNGVLSVIKSVVVASGVAVYHLTIDGLSTGAALCSELFADSINLTVNDPTASYQTGYALSNGNKTVTATVNKLTTANILTGLLGQTQANGTTVKLQAQCAM